MDLLVVGRFGSTTGLSAVSTGSQMLNLVTFVVTQLAMGVTVLIARFLGEKKPDRIGAAVVCALLAVGIGAVLVGLARPPLAVLLQAPEAAIGLAAPISTAVGIVLNIFYYRYLRRKSEIRPEP